MNAFVSTCCTNTRYQGARIVLKANDFGQKTAVIFLVVFIAIMMAGPAPTAWAQTPPPEKSTKSMADTEAMSNDDQANQNTEPQDASEQTQDTRDDGKANVTRVGIIDGQVDQRLEANLIATDPLTESVWLETDQNRYLALSKPALKPRPQGLVILFPDRNQHPDWPETIRPLRNGLAEKGWHTWSIRLPYAPKPKPPARPIPQASEPESDDQTMVKQEQDGESMQDEIDNESTQIAASQEQPANAMQDKKADMAMADTAPKPIAEQIEALRQSLLQRIGTVPNNRLVLIGVGEGAFWASQWAQRLAGENGIDIALVMINARNQVTGSDMYITQFLSTPLPVLDIYASDNNHDARLRQSAGEMAGFTRYIQQDLPLRTLAASRLVNRVHGFARR